MMTSSNLVCSFWMWWLVHGVHLIDGWCPRVCGCRGARNVLLVAWAVRLPRGDECGRSFYILPMFSVGG